MHKILLRVDGMSCSACSNGLEKSLAKRDGILKVEVNLVMSSAAVEYDDTITQKEIERYIKEAGFQSLGLYQMQDEGRQLMKQKHQLIGFTLLAIVYLYITMGTMFGLPMVSFLTMQQAPVVYSLVVFGLTIPFLVYGFSILKHGFLNLIHGVPNMDILVGLGVLTSFVYSVVCMIFILQGQVSYVHSLYFESAALVLYFMKLGRYIDQVSKNKTKSALAGLVQLTPENAVVLRDEQEVTVTLDEIKLGDVVIVKPGGKIAVDGTILTGDGHLDESFITGESMPVFKQVGDSVIAGSLNYDGYFEYRAERIGKDSTVSAIVRLVVEASATKAPIARLADQVSRYFVPIILLVAVASLLGYLWLGFSFDVAMNAFVTVLVVACPCALGLATPLSMVVSEGVCANRGILVKRSEILEQANQIDTVVFDKTGTLTYGKLKIEQLFLYDTSFTEEELIQLVGSFEAKTNHPIGLAFLRYLEEHQIPLLDILKVRTVAGKGIQGTYQRNRYLIGNRQLLEDQVIPEACLHDEQTLMQNGNSVVYVVRAKKVIGMIGVGDQIRKEARSVIQALQQKGIDVCLLTGDHQGAAQMVGQKLGISKVVANVLPAEKATTVQQFMNDGKKVMMVGDGINDAPVLSSALIGVSLQGATDIAMDSADVILMKSDLTRLVDLFLISQQTIRNIRQNLFWAFFYNVCMIPIAMGILRPFGIVMSPMIAGIAMVMSSFTVILNALRLRSLSS